jgi:hypothetical protein
MKREWSHNAAKDTTLEYKVLKQEKELKKEMTQEREYGLGR